MKKTILVSALIFFLFTNAQEQDSFEKWIDKQSISGQQYDSISNILKQALKDKKAINTANKSLGYLNMVEKKYDLSEKYYQANLAINPKSGETHFQLGRLYSRKKDFKKAQIYLDKATLLEPKNSNLLAHRAIFKYTKIDDKIGAENDFNKAIEIDTKNTSIYISRAQYRISENLLTLALIDFNKAIELDPKNYQAYLLRSEIFYNQQKPDLAIKDLSIAISIDEKQESAFTARGSVYASLGEFSKANENFDKSIEIYPNGYYVYYLRSKIKYQAEDMNGSCQDLQLSLDLIKKYDPESPYKLEIEKSLLDYCNNVKPSYYFQRGIALFNMQEFEKSIIEHSKGLEKFPNNSMLHSFRANSFYSLQKFEKAIADYQKANQNIENLKIDMRENPNYNSMETADFEKYVNATIANNYLMMAKSNFEISKYENALSAIDEGIKLMPNIEEFGLENYYNCRGAINMAVGEYEKAIQDFDKCLKLKSSMPVALIARAISKMNLNTRVKNTISSFSIINNKIGFNGKQEFPVQSKTEYSRPNLDAALIDCNLAIEQDAAFGYAYFVRGQIKKLLDKNDFCNDFLKAKKLNFEVNDDLLINCK